MLTLRPRPDKGTYRPDSASGFEQPFNARVDRCGVLEFDVCVYAQQDSGSTVMTPRARRPSLSRQYQQVLLVKNV